MARTIRTFFEHASQESDEQIILDKIESHHLINVLRLNPNDEVIGLDGMGMVFETIILEPDPKSTVLRVIGKKMMHQPVSSFRMCVALTQGNQWDNIVKPLTELGVSRLSPLLTEYTQCKFNKEKEEQKINKWKRLSIEACKQSGNAWLPSIDSPESFSSFANGCEEGDLILMGSLSSSAKSISTFKQAPRKNYTLLIGPEGGWSNEEERIAVEKNFKIFSIGFNTLRVETAAISSLAVAREKFL